MSRTVRRGEIWEVDFETGPGAEQAGRRPALIVQNEEMAAVEIAVKRSLQLP